MSDIEAVYKLHAEVSTFRTASHEIGSDIQLFYKEKEVSAFCYCSISDKFEEVVPGLFLIELHTKKCAVKLCESRFTQRNTHPNLSELKL